MDKRKLLIAGVAAVVSTGLALSGCQQDKQNGKMGQNAQQKQPTDQMKDSDSTYKKDMNNNKKDMNNNTTAPNGNTNTTSSPDETTN